MVVLALTLARAGLGSDPVWDDDDPNESRALVASPTFLDFTNSVTGIIFAYAGQTIYPEMIAEMARPQDFPKALCVSTPYLLSVYTIVGCTAYYYYGAVAPCVEIELRQLRGVTTSRRRRGAPEI